MQISGQIYKIGETQVVSEKFSKRELIIKTEANTPYPQFIKVELTQDKVNILDQYQVGQEVTASINLRGRLHTGDRGEQCYVTLQAWRIEKVGDGAVNNSTETSFEDMSKDLPF